MSARILLVVGTDHHPFDRAVHWADAWAQAHPEDQVEIQYGTSTPPRSAAGVALVGPEELAARMSAADVVITHGGPGTISAAREAGHLPLVLPRNPALGEHVDDHQMRFSAWATGRGMATRCVDTDALTAAVTTAVAGSGTRAEPVDDDARVADSVARFADLVDAPRPRRVADGAPVVVYLAGFGRSGSTLLERLLATLPGVAALGETVHLWERGLVADELCGCGEPFSACAFWSEVGRRAFGGWDGVDVAEVRRLHEAVDRQRRTPVTLLPSPPLAVRQDLARYTALYRAVYTAASDLAGAQVLVDSSKHASLAIALSHDRHVDLRVLHVVRDSRAVAHSWAQAVVRPESAEGTLMPRFSPWTAAGLWASNNVLVDALRLRRVPVHPLRYEDLVADPVRSVRSAWRALDLPGEGVLPMTDRTVDLSPIHSVAGNPMRFRHGPTTVAADERWRTQMDPTDRRVVGGLTAALLWRYGYRGR